MSGTVSSETEDAFARVMDWGVQRGSGWHSDNRLVSAAHAGFNLDWDFGHL